jgi:hypothetical protein
MRMLIKPTEAASNYSYFIVNKIIHCLSIIIMPIICEDRHDLHIFPIENKTVRDLFSLSTTKKLYKSISMV